MLALERINSAGIKTYVTDVWKSICPPKNRNDFMVGLK
jgi:hypothetical protein